MLASVSYIILAEGGQPRVVKQSKGHVMARQTVRQQNTPAESPGQVGGAEPR